MSAVSLSVVFDSTSINGFVKTFSVGESNATDIFKSIFFFINEQTPLRYCLVVVFPGVGEAYRYVIDELTLAASSSNHANVVVTCKN